MPMITYNERSWAIDIISEINLYASGKNKTIYRASGENTINTGKKRLFPDVLLYSKNSEILMGWELKMPDTPVTNDYFIENAKLKASILGLDAFLLWNASTAVLYINDGNDYCPKHTWNSLKQIIQKRSDVEENKNIWKTALYEILDDLDSYFDNGTIQKTHIIDSLKNDKIIEFILRNSNDIAENLKKSARQDSLFSAQVALWWRISKIEYPNQDQWIILSKIILINWINKFIFAHILISFFDSAKKILSIHNETSIVQAIDVFEKISSECNFWNIFQKQLGETSLNEESWEEILELNNFLKEIKISNISQELLQKLLQNTIYSSKRKIAGQYTTPMYLARFLTSLVMLNKELSLHDICCGTGTIPRAAYDLKKESGVNLKNILQSIYCSDKISYPLQLATLALSEPANIGEILQIYKKDCSQIKIGSNIKLKDPYTGEAITKIYNGVDYIVSNLPFIQQEDLKILNPTIKEDVNIKILNYTGEKLTLNNKSDLYAYIPFFLWGLLKPNGRIGLILSNSWLGTEWGGTFRRLLNKFYHIESIIISGKGKWFDNADVVTTLLIMNKRNSLTDCEPSEKTKFISLNINLKEKTNDDIQDLVEDILIDTSNNALKIQEYNTKDLFNLDFNWNVLFCDISWFSHIEEKLIYANRLFDINRGERRGWDSLFYPNKSHKIEDLYIKPVLKNSKNISTLVTSANSEAFCCSNSLDDIKKLKQKETLKWIAKFENEVNGKGEPLPKILKRTGCYWYEMKATTMADFVASINYDKRLFIARLEERSFVNQRLTRFTIKSESLDLDLIHAFFNSSLGLFFIESLGFGRGLGVLDLSSKRMQKLRILNPDLLSKKQKDKIKLKFVKIKERKILSILDELECEDRKEFDHIVFEEFGISKYKTQVIESLKFLYNIRMNIKK